MNILKLLNVLRSNCCFEKPATDTASRALSGDAVESAEQGEAREDQLPRVKATLLELFSGLAWFG